LPIEELFRTLLRSSPEFTIERGLSQVIATQFQLSPQKAEAAIEAARREMAL
jgi:hypothetical protein